MVKKRLSDLLQEEAQKSSPPEGETTIEVTAIPVHSPVDEVQEAASNPAEEDLTLVVEEATAKRTHPTKAELEATVKELTQTVEEVRQKEATLEQQIDDLQSALSEQKELALRLKKELKEAKQAAVYLAEANSKLTEDINTLEQEKNINTLAQEKNINTLEQEKNINTLKPEPTIPRQTNYKKSYQKLENLPQKQPQGSIDASPQTWLLD